MISKKKNGFRKITIENEIYNWRFSGIIEIRPNENQSNKLEIDFGWFDEWLFLNDKVNRPEEFEPKIVTPNFVKKSIINARKFNWNTKEKNIFLRLKYRNGIFEVENKNLNI